MSFTNPRFAVIGRSVKLSGDVGGGGKALMGLADDHTACGVHANLRSACAGVDETRDIKLCQRFEYMDGVDGHVVVV